MAKLPRIYQSFGKHKNKMRKEACHLLWVFTKMPFYFSKSTNSGKYSIKGLAKFKRDDKRGHLLQIAIIIKYEI